MKEGMRILEFSNEFAEKVKKFLVEVCIDEFGFEEWREELETIDREKYKENGGNFWIALDNKKEVIGTIGLENISNGVGMLKTMYVHKEYRGYKVAQKLMEDLTNFAVNNNFKKIQLGTYKKLERAVGFYKKNDFYLAKEDCDVLIFEKILSN